MSKFTTMAAAATVLLGAVAVVPASAEVFNGFFAGLQVGDTFGEGNQSQSAAVGGPFTVAVRDYKVGALEGGAHIGFSLPLEQFVVSIVGDYNFTDISEIDNASGGDLNSFEVDNIATLRARGGWLVFPRSLLYVTGGGAWMQGELSIDLTTAVSTAEKHDADFSGYTYGLGAEFAIGEAATFGLEWRRYEFDRERVSFTAALNGYDIGVDPEFDTVELSFSYYFSDMMN